MVFNVSVGDFICVINLVIEILGALEQSHGAAPQFQDLMGAFDSLKDALNEVGSVNCNSLALSPALKRAEGAIERFLKKVEIYQPSLQVGGSKSKWKDAICKIKWALFQKDDVNAFRAEISMHMNSIQLLLLSTCRAAAAAERRKDILEMRQYMLSANARMNETQASLTKLDSTLSHYAVQLRNFLQSIFRTNIAILNAILFSRHRFDMPMSICWDSPVNFQDAQGRYLPINVGFVNCWESFQHALLNLHKDRPGLDKIENRYYKLQDAKVAGKWSEFQAGLPFDEVFAPGGFVDLTLMFPYERDGDFQCPKCGWPEDSLAEYSKVECPNQDCDLNYSKSDYLCIDIFTLPAHFDPPPVSVTLSDAEKAESLNEERGEVGKSDSHAQGGQCEIAVDEPASSKPKHHDDRQNAENVNNFRNIYITRPAAALLRGPSKTWYHIPWRVAQSFNGIQFIVDQYTSGLNSSYKLRDRNVGWVLNEKNWQARAWPGMMIEMEDASALEAAVPRAHRPTSALTLRCQLCRKLFGNERALSRHTATNHLSHQPCPTNKDRPCNLCDHSRMQQYDSRRNI